MSLDLTSHGDRVRQARAALSSHLQDERSAYGERFVRPEISTEVGPHQRHQIRVPTRSAPDGTVLSMGRRQDGRNHDGAGLTTNAHVDVRASGGKAESRMTLQANGQLVVQSDMDSAYVISAAPAVIASSAVTNVLGASGVVIASGAAVPLAPLRVEGESPTTPAATGGHADAMQAEVDAWTSANDVLDGALADRDALQAEMAPDQASEIAPTKTDLSVLASDTFTGPNALGEQVQGEAGALALSGAGGVLVSTPLHAALHAGEMASVCAPTVAVVGTEAVDLVAKTTLAATSETDARLFAGARLDLVAHTGPLHMASRSGEMLEVQAPEIRVGATEPASPQQATRAVSMESTEHFGLSTGGACPDASQAGMHLASHDVIEASADKTITISAADTITLEIGGQPIKIVVDKAKTVTVTVQSTELALSASGGLVVKHRGEVLKGSSSTCFLGPSPSSRFEATTSQVSIKGSAIKLG